MGFKTEYFAWLPESLAFAARRWRIVAISCGVVTAFAIFYILVATPQYTATTTLLIDTQAGQAFQAQPQQTDAEFANGIVESQVEVLTSDGLARSVVERLHLASDREFLANGHSIVGSVTGFFFGMFTPSGPAVAGKAETKAAELLVRMIKARRIGLSFVIDVTVRSTDPTMSARLANALTAAYIDMGLEAKNGNTRRASAWLQDRIGGLKQQANDADKAVQAFKAKAHLVDTDRGLMSQRHLGELNSQLVLARSRTADARAKYDQITAILSSGNIAGNVTDALANEVVVHLREAYVDAARQAAEWQTKYGPDHVAVKNMRVRMADIQAQLRGELQRIAAGYQSDYTIAKASEQDIERQLQSLAGDASTTNEDLVTLRGLQSSADTYLELYEAFLQRYTQAVQDQSFPISEAQVVTPAVPPLRASWPMVPLLLAGGIVFGLGVGFAVAFMRDVSDRSLRTALQVREVLGLTCLGLLPLIPARRSRERRGVLGTARPRQITNVPSMLSHVASTPFSAFAETVRGIRVRMSKRRDGARMAKIIGCGSILAGEGKTTFAANFAFFLAKAGFRTLLIDWSTRAPALSLALAPNATSGFADVCAGRIALEDAVWRDEATGLEFLPCDKSPTPHDIFDDPACADLLHRLRDRYDHIIIDLPTLGAVSEAQVAAQLVDGLLLVVEWGRTSQEVILEALHAGGVDERNVVGVILNKVDTKLLPSYSQGRAVGYQGAERRELVG